MAFGQSQERIIRFHSDIKIDTDGRIEVAEHIKVYAAGDEIKRGIIREIPLYRTNNIGKRVRMNYKILSVQRDGRDTKYDTENESGNMLIYIRDVNVLLKPGEYDYTVVYESYGQIGFFDDYDELYWNVTGNTSVFSVEQASAAITLPGDAVAGKTTCYTGKQGSREQDCSVENRGNVQVFTANRRLAPREGLTVAVAFPRDIITRPPPPTEAEMFWNEHSYSICGLTGTFICILFFYFSFRKVGKRPIKPVAIPTFKPPRDMSPASVYYLATRGYGNKAFTATFVEMAVKGAMNIRCEKKKKYSLVNKKNTEWLRSEEKLMHDVIFAGDSKESVEVKQENYTKFSKADTILRKAMGQQWNLKDFSRENRGHIAFGGFLLNVVFALYVYLTGATEEVFLALALVSPIIALEIAIMLSTGLDAEIGCKTYVSGFLLVLFLVAYVWVEVYDDDSGAGIHWLSAVFFAALSLLYMVYSKRIKSVSTAEGVKIAAELEGFKMYMKTAEEHRLNILTPPERTPELFEKLLPYAIALGVSNEWCKKFDDVLKQFNYRPEWYNGAEDFAVVGFATTFTALGSSFVSSVSSASTSPSSGSSDWSSGSSGGGYSGGGGGGGGVRGC